MDKLEKLAEQLTETTTYEALVYKVKFTTISNDHVPRSATATVVADNIDEAIDVLERHIDVHFDDDMVEITCIERNGLMLIDLRRWNYEREELEDSA